MTRFLIATAILASLAGCGGGSDMESGEEKTPSPQTSTTSQIPKPDQAQADALVKQLDAIAPGLAGEAEDTVENARNVCTSILGGGKNLTESTKTRFTGDGVDSMTDDQAAQIVDAIKAAPWCKA